MAEEEEKVDYQFEEITPWDGEKDTGYDVRMKWKRNFARVATYLNEVRGMIADVVNSVTGVFLRKDQDDKTEHSLGVGGELTVGGDLTVGGTASVDGDVNVGCSQTVVGDSSVGGQQTVLGDSAIGGSQNIEGSQTVKGSQNIEGSQTVKGSQTIKGDSLIEGLLSLIKGAASPDFLAGLLGTGFELRKDAETGRWRLEIDELVVRVVATFFELVIHKLRHVGGSIVLSPGSMQCIRVEETADAYRCYFKSSEGDKVVANEFVVGDQVRCQSFNLKAADGGGVKTTFYWRLVVGVGDDWIDLSKTDCAAGSDVPAPGDDIVHLGNRDDVTRQNAIILDTVGSDAPSIKQYHGINSYVLTDDLAITVFSSRGNRIRGQFVSEATGVDYDEAIGAIGEQMQGIKVNVDAIKEQSDKEFTLWFGTVDPTTTNAPASEWTTEEDKAMHLKDIYYNEDAGLAWDWLLGEDGAYYWHSCTDRETLRALEKAAKAQDTADGKRRNFVAQPGKEDAYDVGDTWCNATFGELYDNDTLVCITAKAAGAAFSIEHWKAANTATTAYIKNLGKEIRQVVADNKNAGDLATKAAKDAADAAQKAANDAATAASNAATAASNAQTTANTAATDATKAQNTADTAKETADKAKSSAAANATAIVQTNTSISTLAGKFTFDENGNVKNIDKSGLVLTSNFASLYSESVNKDTNVVKKADISAMVTKDADGNISSEVKISADQITMKGDTVFATPEDVSKAKQGAIDTASADATTKANTAQSNAEKNAATDAAAKVKELKDKLGSLAYKSSVGASALDSTVISGGKILTSLIKADELQVKSVYAESSDGTTTAKIDGATGKLTAKQAELQNCTVSGSISTPYLLIDSADTLSALTDHNGTAYVSTIKIKPDKLNIQIGYWRFYMASGNGASSNIPERLILPTNDELIGSEANIFVDLLNKKPSYGGIPVGHYTVVDDGNTFPYYQESSTVVKLGGSIKLKLVSVKLKSTSDSRTNVWIKQEISNPS